MEIVYLLFTLMCPLSMVALVAWWAWSTRRSRGSSRPNATARSAAEEAEITRMRAQLDQLSARGRDETAPPAGARRVPAPPRSRT